MKTFRSTSLRVKLFGLTAVLVGLVAVDTLLAPTGAGALVVLAAAVLVGGVVAAATERQMSANIALIDHYLAAAEEATRENLTRGWLRLRRAI